MKIQMTEAEGGTSEVFQIWIIKLCQVSLLLCYTSLQTGSQMNNTLHFQCNKSKLEKNDLSAWTYYITWNPMKKNVELYDIC